MTEILYNHFNDRSKPSATEENYNGLHDIIMIISEDDLAVPVIERNDVR